MTMFSRTVSSMSSVSSCGTTPSRERIFTPSRIGSRPNTRSVPSVMGETQPIILIVDVFPAPFGPRKPKASPLRKSKSIASTAVSSPKRLTSPRAWINGCPFCSPTPAKASRRDLANRAPRLPRRLDVDGDLLDERLLRLEHRLVPQTLPELDDE